MEHIFLYKIGQFVALRLPLKLSYLLAVLFSDIRYPLARVDRINVTANLKTIFPDKNEKEIARIRIELFRNFAKYLVDFFSFQRVDSNFVTRNISIKNIHFLDDVLSAGKGAIGLSAHIGSWELGGVTLALLGYPFWAVALPHKNKEVDDFFNSSRTQKGVNIIPFGHAFMRCLSLLKEGKIVALVGDRDFSEKGIMLDFFGKPTVFTRGPAALSLASGCPIVPVFIVREKNDKFTLVFERAIEFSETGEREKDIKDLTERFKNVIENYVKRYPEQWFMFKRFWIEQ